MKFREESRIHDKIRQFRPQKINANIKENSQLQMKIFAFLELTSNKRHLKQKEYIFAHQCFKMQNLPY